MSNKNQTKIKIIKLKIKIKNKLIFKCNYKIYIINEFLMQLMMPWIIIDHIL